MTAEELVCFAEDLARIAASGGGARALASHLAAGAKVGVLVEDARWHNVVAAGKVAVPSVSALLDPGADPKRFQRLRNGYPGRTLAIVAGDARLGQLTLFGNGNLDEFEFAARLTASALAVALAGERESQPARKRTFWERLAGGAHQDAAAARDDAAARGISIATHYIAVALEAEPSNAPLDANALRTRALETFRSADAEIGVLERGATLLLFLPAAREINAANARTAATLFPKTLAKSNAHLRVSGGVGSRVPVISLSESLAQAEAALTIARRLHGVGYVGVYEDLGAYPLLLRGADPAALREFAHNKLTPLREYDAKHQTELERTLRLYFAVGENVKTAASQLNVHRHTVFYRLRQIGELCGCKLDDAHDQLTLRMALAIDALNG